MFGEEQEKKDIEEKTDLKFPALGTSRDKKLRSLILF